MRTAFYLFYAFVLSFVAYLSVAFDTFAPTGAGNAVAWVAMYTGIAVLYALCTATDLRDTRRRRAFRMYGDAYRVTPGTWYLAGTPESLRAFTVSVW